MIHNEKPSSSVVGGEQLDRRREASRDRLQLDPNRSFADTRKQWRGGGCRRRRGGWRRGQERSRCSRVIRESRRAGSERIIRRVVHAQRGGRATKEERNRRGRRQRSGEGRAEVAVRVVVGGAQIRPGVARSTPTDGPINRGAELIPQSSRCEVAGGNGIGHREVGRDRRALVTRKAAGGDQNALPGAAASSSGWKGNKRHRITSSGVDHDERRARDEILSRGTHAQLHRLRCGVTINPTDHLLDLHKVEGGVGLKRERTGSQRGDKPPTASRRGPALVCFHCGNFHEIGQLFGRSNRSPGHYPTL